jgi:hypothetical protein
MSVYLLVSRSLSCAIAGLFAQVSHTGKPFLAGGNRQPEVKVHSSTLVARTLEIW